MKFSLIIALLALPYFAVSQEVEVPKEPLLELTKGDRWEYQVRVIAPSGAKMPTGEGVKVKETSDGIVATFQKVRIYEGKKEPKEGKGQFDSFRVESQGKLEEFEYSEVRPNAIYARGWKKEGEKPGPIFFLEKPLLTISATNEAGDHWAVKSGDGKETPLFTRKFRVFGWEEIEVPAGKFNALRIEVSGKSEAIESKRTYWFVKGVGFIKEMKSYYSQTKRLLHQEMVLTKYELKKLKK